VELYAKDSKMNFFKICEQQLVPVLPILHRIKNKVLNLSGYNLNSGICKALQIALPLLETFITKISFNNNGLHDA
jgi:hypothetical protein